MMDYIPEWLFGAGMIVLLFIGLICGLGTINILVDNVPTVCYVDGKKVYDGPSVGINIGSSGANTTVKILGGLFYFFPKAYYVSKNVKLVGKK